MIALRGRLERVRAKENPVATPTPAAAGATAASASAASAPASASALAAGPAEPSAPAEASTETATTASNNSQSFTWKWTGQWAFAQSISEADVALFKASSAAAASWSTGGAPPLKQLFPFSYEWESAVDPFDVRVPSEEIAFKESEGNLKMAEKEETETAAATAATVAAAEGGASQDAAQGSEGSVNVTTGNANKPANVPTPNAPATSQSESKTENPPASKSSGNKQTSFKPDLPPVSTFADHGFTDASTKFGPERCPTGGRWKGSFDTAAPATITRKSIQPNPPTIPIPESFSLFINSTPSSDVKTQFVPEENESIMTNAVSALSEGCIHARGSGDNQYGIFELIGSLHVESGILQLQKMYVQTPESEAARSAANKRSSPRGRRRSVRSPLETTDAQARGTRKRSLSWKRRSMMETNDDDLITAGKGKKARKRVSSIGDMGHPTNATVSAEGTDHVDLTGDPSHQVGWEQPLQKSQDKQLSGATAPTSLEKWSVPPISIPGKSGGEVKRGASAGGGGGSKKRASSGNASTPRGAPVLKLPPAGDPAKARWRAAHYLYYYKPSPSDEAATNSGAGGSNSAANGNCTKSVVYEGEMFNGKRHGRGVCLHDNSLIYEGEWRYDKEHGFGTLFSEDRKRIIYEGEWERGRIHGIGKYYYGDDDNSNDGGNKGSKKKRTAPTAAALMKNVPVRSKCRYEGEFRENLRHGDGIYVLPDSSVYDGAWANGTMTGLGVFRWPDGSVYDGDWKDNRRHGQGILRASDGFIYDGTWFKNCMEGRGSATYPSGQQYHGMFSNGRREGRGTIIFPNGAVYEGRFRDDAVDGQGTMKIRRTVVVPSENSNEEKPDFMIPVSFQSDMGHIHRKAGFTVGGK
mmetsp:Transcript_12409/g.34426  ORF Transcript_12409/g.34426 Transcript_12409/m.34426 type:complete len:868 (-) Transcript_12409:51-2654(-)